MDFMLSLGIKLLKWIILPYAWNTKENNIDRNYIFTFQAIKAIIPKIIPYNFSNNVLFIDFNMLQVNHTRNGIFFVLIKPWLEQFKFNVMAKKGKICLPLQCLWYRY